MPALTKIQLAHATQRLRERRQEFLDKAHAEAYKGLKLGMTLAEKHAAVMAGTARVKPLDELRNYTDFVGAFEFFTPAEQALLDEARQVFLAVEAKANADEQRIHDELVMSPDGMAALARIAEAFGG